MAYYIGLKFNKEISFDQRDFICNRAVYYTEYQKSVSIQAERNGIIFILNLNMYEVSPTMKTLKSQLKKALMKRFEYSSKQKLFERKPIIKTTGNYFPEEFVEFWNEQAS